MPLLKNGDSVVSLVLDSAPLIKKINLFQMAEKFYTIPEVLAEIRDKQARENLENSLIDIKVKIPTEEALYQVTSFAKKTGDFATLSKTDLKVLALTWMLEKEAGNASRLRTEPVNPITKFGKQKTKSKKSKENEKSEEKGKESEEQSIEKNEDNLDSEYGKFNRDINWEGEFEEIIDKDFDSEFEDIEDYENMELENVNNEEEQNSTNNNEGEESTTNNVENNNNEESVESEVKVEDTPDNDEDDDEGWITPDNINKYHAKAKGINPNKKRVPKVYKVACMTSDFAMQNVLLQMNMKILSADGMIVHKLKNWVLRCHACYFSTSDMSKKFCPQCGHNTLIRTSVSIDKYGNKVFHLKKNFVYRTRGTKYPIPTYVGGQKANNIILSEDQHEYQKALKQQKFKARKEKVVDLLDPDYLNTLFMGEDSKISSRSKKGRKTQNDYTGDIIVGYGRRNPNERRRRK